MPELEVFDFNLQFFFKMGTLYLKNSEDFSILLEISYGATFLYSFTCQNFSPVTLWSP